MQKYSFLIGQSYSRREIYRIIGISEDTHGGNWDTGYNRLGKDWFLFCNVGVPGKTGHDYPNEFIGDDLRWFGKLNSKLGNPSIQSMLSREGYVYIFTRNKSKLPFIFAGTARPHEAKDSTPVEIVWSFIEGLEQRPELIAEEILPQNNLYEGATKTIRVDVHERNPEARRLCIESYGTRCMVCEVDLEKIYGEIAKGFIHVHHLRPIGETNETYKIDPIRDLRPVCPNCHTMLHRRQPILSIEELRDILVTRPLIC